MELPSPLPRIIALLPYILSTPPIELPSNLKSNSISQSHLYLNQSPTSLNYLQSITIKPNIGLNERLITLGDILNGGEKIDEVEFGLPEWRVEGDGEIKVRVIFNSIYSTSSSSSIEGVEEGEEGRIGIILIWEEDKLGMNSMGLELEDGINDNEPNWYFLSIVDPNPSSTLLGGGGGGKKFWEKNLELAFINMKERMNLISTPSTITSTATATTSNHSNTGDHAEGNTTPGGSYDVAEDFWDGWEEDNNDNDDDEVINKHLNFSQSGLEQEELDRYGSTSNSNSNSNNGYQPIIIPTSTTSRYDLPIQNENNSNRHTIEEDEETGLNSNTYWESYGSIESTIGDQPTSSSQEDSFGGRNRSVPVIINRSRRSSTIKAVGSELNGLNGTSTAPTTPTSKEITSSISIPSTSSTSTTSEESEEEILKLTLKGIWKLYSKGVTEVELEVKKKRWLDITGEVLK